MIANPAPAAGRGIFAAALAFAALAGLAVVSQANFLLFHSLAETFSAVVAFGIFAVAWNARRFCDSPFFLFIGVAYLAVGALDLQHAFSHKGLGIFSDQGANRSTQLWIVARYVEAISCLLAILLGGRGRMPEWLPVAYVSGAGLLIAGLFRFDLLPACYIDGVGPTTFKVASEYVVVGLKGASALLLVADRTLHGRVKGLLLGYLAISAAAEIAFTQGFGGYELSDQIGHLLKVLAFGLIYNATIRAALVEPYGALFRNLQTAKDDLEQAVTTRTRQLAQTNEALVAAKARLDALIKASPLAIVALDRDGRITLWNAAAERLYGWRAEEVLGQHLPTAAEDWQQRQQQWAMAAVLGGEFIDGLETRRMRKDRAIVHMRLHCAPLFDEQGGITGAMAVCANIGEEHRARQVLREREEHLRSIMQNVADAIITIDEQGVIESFNAAAEEVFGYSAPEVVGRNVSMLMPAREAAKHDGHLKSYRDTGVSRLLGTGPREVPALRKGGTETVIELQVDETVSGRRRIFIGVARDITARRQAAAEKAALQNELMQAHKMEALGNLAGGIAHEVNNMLVPIIGLTDISLKRAPPELHSNLEKVLVAAERARQIVGRVLTFSRAALPQPKPVPLAEVMGDAKRLLSVGLPAAIEIRYHIKAEGLVVMADPTEIHQVLTNLINNAAQAIGARTGVIDVTLEAQDAPQATGLAGRCAVLTVEDNGCGIDGRTLPKIFEPFFTTKEVGIGTGMGLSVVHGIVTKCGGAIAVDSRLGGGTRFTIRLPLHEAADTPSAEAASA